MNNQPVYIRFDKQMSSIVKGCAILFMMMLHCYGKEYAVSLNYDFAVFSHFNGVFKICIGIYSFMVGFGYAFSKNKDWHYSIQHIKKLLVPFWVILFVFTLPLCYQEVIDRGIVSFIYELFGISSHFNWYSWFVYFFIFAMIVMPLVSRFIDHKPLINTLFSVAGSYLICVAVHSIPGSMENKPLLALFNSLMMTPIMLLGYLFAHEHYYEKINIGRYPRYITIVMSLILIVLVFVVRRRRWAILAFQLDFFYAPLVIFGIVVIFSLIRWQPVKILFSKLGEVSVYMWFLHALFFTEAVAWFYQPMITIFDNVNLVVIWAITLTFFVSWLLKSIVDQITKRITTNSAKFLAPDKDRLKHNS